MDKQVGYPWPYQLGENKMKRILVVALFLIVSSFGILYASTFEEGYQAGYADAIRGMPNIYEVQAIQENQNTDFGMWEVYYYVDDFGDYTEEGYITNADWIYGTFNNSATRNSSLKVNFLIGKDYCNIALYEYDSNRVTGHLKYPTAYTIGIKDQYGRVFRTSGKNYSDRILINYADIPELFVFLKEGGELKFNIVETDTPTTSYNFVITDSKGFDRILEAL